MIRQRPNSLLAKVDLRVGLSNGFVNRRCLELLQCGGNLSFKACGVSWVSAVARTSNLIVLGLEVLLQIPKASLDLRQASTTGGGRRLGIH